MATLREIADRCGVSVQTASAVLNTERAKLFRPEMRRRIEAAAEEVGYAPNRAARVLRGVRTRTIGVISHGISSMSGLAQLDMIAALDQALDARGYRTLQGFCWRDPDRVNLHVKEMLGHRVEGIIFLCPKRYFLDHEPKVEVPALLPVVSVDHAPVSRGDQVLLDRRAAMAGLMEQAVRLGHRQFAFVCSKVSTNREKYEAVAEAARRRGGGLSAERVFEGATGKEVNSPFIDSLLTLRPMPTWIACSNDFVAAGVIQGLRRRGLHVPGEVSVSGHDDLWCMRHFDPPLTTLRLPLEEMGRRMAEMVLERIERPGLPRRVETFVPELKLRESTGPSPVQVKGEGHVPMDSPKKGPSHDLR